MQCRKLIACYGDDHGQPNNGEDHEDGADGAAGYVHGDGDDDAVANR